QARQRATRDARAPASGADGSLNQPLDVRAGDDRKFDPPGHDADHHSVFAIERNLFTYQRRVRAETPPPQTVAHDNDALNAPLIFFRAKRTPQRRRDAERRECVVRYLSAEQLLRLALPSQRRLPVLTRHDVIERFRLIAP